VWVASGGQCLAAGWGDGVFLAARAGLMVGCCRRCATWTGSRTCAAGLAGGELDRAPVTRAVVAELLAAPAGAAAG
jgi:hypothetical protein